MSLKASAILPLQADEVGGQAHGEVAVAERDHRGQQLARERVAAAAAARRWRLVPARGKTAPPR